MGACPTADGGWVGVWRASPYVVVVVVLCVVAGRWQLDRHEQRVERNDALTTAAAGGSTPQDTSVRH